jgi:hypothetical protein
VKIVWDELKRLANLEKHGLDFAERDEAFFKSALVAPGNKPKRWHRQTYIMKASKKRRGFTAKDLKEVSDSPELTKADFAEAKPFSEVGSTHR